MLSEQDKCEIRKSYRNAIEPRQQVKILMDLYLASREEIEETLGFTPVSYTHLDENNDLPY